MRRILLAAIGSALLMGGSATAMHAAPSGHHPGCAGVTAAAGRVTMTDIIISSFAAGCEGAPEPPGWDIKIGPKV